MDGGRPLLLLRDEWQRALELHGRVEVPSSRRRLALLVLVGVVMTAVSVFCTGLGVLGLVAGAVGAVFFGACGLVGVARLVTGGKLLVITAGGAEVDGWFRVAWIDVVRVLVLEQGQQQSVLLRVRDEGVRDRACTTARYRLLVRLNRSITKGADLVLPAELDAPKQELAAWLATLVPTARPAP